MTTQGFARLRSIRDQLDLSANELAATVERLPTAWREGVGADLERLVSEARVLTRSVDRALEGRRTSFAEDPDESERVV